jgi:leucine dehydrogenase
VTDVSVARVQEATAKFDATAVEPETIVMAKYDVLSPNDLGAILDDDTIPRLHARVTAGAAASRPDVKAAV